MAVLSRFHDATNAFYSLNQEKVIEDIAPPYSKDEEAHALLTQRLKYATMRLSWAQCTSDVLVGQGVIPGDHAGPLEFIRSYGKVMEETKE
eukprot:9735720-Lingulodinium_polyedra.AAC.1